MNVLPKKPCDVGLANPKALSWTYENAGANEPHGSKAATNGRMPAQASNLQSFSFRQTIFFAKSTYDDQPNFDEVPKHAKHQKQHFFPTPKL